MPDGLESLKVYQLANRLAVYVFKITKTFPRSAWSEARQLRRSSSSVADNIAEAYGRFTFKDRVNKLHIARGEAEETRKGIERAGEKDLLPPKVVGFTVEKYTELMKMINGYIKYLRSKK